MDKPVADTPEPTSPNLLGLPASLSDWDTAQVAILPVPHDDTASYGVGARFGPQAIIDASHEIELFDHELSNEPCNVGVHTRPPLGSPAGGPEAMAERVEGEIALLFCVAE